MKPRTAIIVNDRGEGFIGWRSHCDVSASGFETYRSEPHFAKREWAEPSAHPLFHGYYPPKARWVNDPVVFSSPRAAARAMARIERRTLARLAVVS